MKVMKKMKREVELMKRGKRGTHLLTRWPNEALCHIKYNSVTSGYSVPSTQCSPTVCEVMYREGKRMNSTRLPWEISINKQCDG